MVWNPGDDDLMEVGAGADTAEVNGGNGAETFALAANGLRVRFDRVDPAPFGIDIGATETVVLNAGGGNDTVDASALTAGLTAPVVDGGAGDDSIDGSQADDVLLGGDGNDRIDGGRGDDVALLGAGDDVFVWDPGEGDDVVEGQAGLDAMDFNGSNANESIDISANGGRVRFFRDVAAVVMDLNDVERIDFQAFGGADRVTVGDLSGTDLRRVVIDLAAVGGGDDGQADTVVVDATNGDDAVVVAGGAGGVTVAGLAVEVTILGFGAGDRLVVNGLAGDDVVEASGLGAGGLLLAADGGDGGDVLIGGGGGDVLTGGAGDDVLIGGLGLDVLDGGAGDNILIQ